jgi:hypothetical protein
MLPEAARLYVPWFWTLNGVASILGSGVVVALVVEHGFRIAGLLPAVLYATAGLAARALPREHKSEAIRSSAAAPRRAG